MEETLATWYNRIYKSVKLPREVTIQLTEACNLQCTYCYQIAKTPKVMTLKTGKKIIDYILELSQTDNNSPINLDTPWIVLDFIGGEPLLETKLMSDICFYFLESVMTLRHRWSTNFTISISSNGTLYFTKEVQKFLKDFEGHVSFSVSIDGDKEAHDSCRIFPDGKGSFDLASRAQADYITHYQHKVPATKATIARANLPYIDRIIKYFASQGYTDINANTVYEEDWDIEDAKLFYKKLKEISDFNLTRDSQINLSLFNENFFRNKQDMKQTWCGGFKDMLAFDTEGNAYPCIRYMPTSLGNTVPPIVIGDCWNGLYNNKQQLTLMQKLSDVTWTNQNTEECLDCPIAEGCAECGAWSYQACGELGKRNMNSCVMHKARSLGNVYYWNSLYRKQGSVKRFKRNLPDEDALKIVSKEELELLNTLEEL